MSKKPREKKAETVTVAAFIFTDAHSGSPDECPACRISIRPPCRNCGHSLTGSIQNYETICENCGQAQEIVF